MVARAGNEIHPWVAVGAERLRFAVRSIFLQEPQESIRAAQRAEALGFDAYWSHDHPNRLTECWTELAVLARETEHLRLISLVSCIYYRSPHLLARQAADVDRLSGGRLVLGVGVGDDIPEFEQMCLPFPPLRERQAALEETIAIVRGLWSGVPFSYSGAHFQVRDATLRGLPVQRPHVPILIGGGGERVTLRQVAQYADMSNFAPHEWSGGAYEVSDVARKYEVLRQHCTATGRPFEAILRSHFTPLLCLAKTRIALSEKREGARIPDPHLRQNLLFATPDEAITHFQGLADAGVQYFMISVDGRDDETVHLLADEVVGCVRLPSTVTSSLPR